MIARISSGPALALVALIGLVGFVTLVTLPSTGHAQTAVGDSLWRVGKFDEARAAYERAIAEDRNSVRANVRLAQFLANGSNIDSALVLLRAARARVPDDPDLLFTEATYLSWARRFPEAIARYDSLIAKQPGRDFDYVRVARARTLSWSGRLEDARAGYASILVDAPNDRDAKFGLAQVRAWTGDLTGAAQAYESLLTDDPDDPRVLIGLAAVRSWLGRPGTALRLLDRSATRAPDDPDAASLRAAILAQNAPQFSIQQNYSEDSDINVNRWSIATARMTIGNVRSFLSWGALNATDPIRNSRRQAVDAGASLPVGRVMLSGALGTRVLRPTWRIASGNPVLPDRQVLTMRASAAMPVTARVSATVGVARWPFDEIASLLGRALDVDQQDLSVDWRATSKLRVSTNVTRLAFSDDNTRTTGSMRLAYPLARGFTLNAYGIGFGFANRSTSYFSPSAFRAIEVGGGWAHDSPIWGALVSGGVGVQRIDTGLPMQSQWHLDARVRRQITPRVDVEAFGARSTSAAASAVGAYQYDLIGIGLLIKPR